MVLRKTIGSLLSVEPGINPQAPSDTKINNNNFCISTINFNVLLLLLIAFSLIFFLVPNFDLLRTILEILLIHIELLFCTVFTFLHNHTIPKNGRSKLKRAKSLSNLKCLKIRVIVQDMVCLPCS